MFGYTLVIIGVAFLALGIGGLVTWQQTDTMRYMWEPKEQACIASNGQLNEGCLIYYDSITGNVKATVTIGFAFSIGLVGFGAFLAHKERQEEKREAQKQ